jgi:hypothetical protein
MGEPLLPGLKYRHVPIHRRLRVVDHTDPRPGGELPRYTSSSEALGVALAEFSDRLQRQMPLYTLDRDGPL